MKPKMLPGRRMLAGWLLFLLTPLHADQTLLEFGPVPGVDRLRKTDARVEPVRTADGRPAIRIRTGTAQSWPGVTLPAPTGHWDLSAFGRVEVDVRNVGDSRTTVYCRVDNPGADGVRHCLTGHVGLEPGGSRTLVVPLTRTSGDTLDGKLFGLRGYPVAAAGDRSVDPANVTQVLLFVSKPTAPHVFEVRAIRATGSWTPPTAWTSDATPYFPLIDTFGQYRHKDWPGKVHTLTELRERREAEARELAATPGPEGWDRYGGWAAGPQLEATGFFRVQKHAGKWWLVDPEGRLFWSHGIDCVRMLDSTFIAERETWFEDFPGDQAGFAEFIIPRARALKGHYAGRSERAFSFAGANLKRKYGDDWKQSAPPVIHQRLRSWGLNTIANWSDEGVRLLRRTPYTDTVSSRGAPDIEGSEGYWGKFPDVFDPAFAEGLRRSMAGRIGRSANDPWCIGYFSDNEMSWGDELSLSVAALRSPAGQAAKRAFIADLQARYGDVTRLNEVWGVRHASWEALLESREAPDVARAREDLAAFYTQAAERYFRLVRDAIKAVAPNQLYLGCRFAWVNDRAAMAAAKYCDIVSYNRYERSVADFQYPGGDKPLIIGEFHFGALDRGLFHTGLVPVENQGARAQAYRDYVKGALGHPQFVGTHWFQYQDEPTTGRVYDEENYQIGFVDIADTPYPEIIAASRQIGTRLYEMRMRP
ncbi:MAG: beta-galactosidase [Verrucomicrobiales bacterium]|nr:beta-galactosidase [Verrucomicrobiales bacterium]